MTSSYFSNLQFHNFSVFFPSVLWHYWLGGMKSVEPAKILPPEFPKVYFSDYGNFLGNFMAQTGIKKQAS